MKKDYMKYHAIRLTKKRLLGERFSNKTNDSILETIHQNKQKNGEFFWHNMSTPFAIDENVTLEDLIKILFAMNRHDLHALSVMSDANIFEYMDDYSKNPDPIPDNDTYGKLTAIEVYKALEFDNFRTGGDVFDMNSYTSAHGIGEIWSQTMSEVNNGNIKLEDAMDCNTYAIEFIPWQKMLHLPITIQKYFYITETVWKKVKPKKLEIDVVGSKNKFSFGWSDKEFVDKKRLKEKKITTRLTMQEFFNGLFNEICFFGSPVKREEESNTLKERMDEVDKVLKKNK